MSGLGSLLTGVGGMWQNQQSTKRTNKFNRRWDKNLLLWDQQKQKNQIQWRAQDAKAAGFHPLAALGISPSSSSVSATAGIAPNMGQNLARAGSAIDRLTDRKARNMDLAIKKAELDRMNLTNYGLLKDLIDANTAPKIPSNKHGIIPGQTTSSIAAPGTTLTPTEVPYSSSPGTQAGLVPGSRMALMPGHTVLEVPSKPLEEALDADPFAKGISTGIKTSELLRNYKTGIKGGIGNYRRLAMDRIGRRPSPSKGYKYLWSIKRNSFVRVYDPNNHYKGFFTNQKIRISYKNPKNVDFRMPHKFTKSIKGYRSKPFRR